MVTMPDYLTKDQFYGLVSALNKYKKYKFVTKFYIDNVILEGDNVKDFNVRLDFTFRYRCLFFVLSIGASYFLLRSGYITTIDQLIYNAIIIAGEEQVKHILENTP